MLELRNINKTFHKGQVSETKALSDISLAIKAQEFLVIVGANGSGKSTLLNSISGSTTIDSGKILLEGKEIQRLAEHQRSKWIARVFQNPLAGTAPALSILDNFRLAALRTVPKMLKIGTSLQFKQQVQEKIATLNMGLENKLDQQMGSLSGGQRQALTLLMSVMSDLKVLLLDEPTAALDPKSAKMVMKLAQKLIEQHQLTTILITHNLNEAIHYGNRLIQLEVGQIKRVIEQKEKANLNQSEMLSWFDYFDE